LRKETLSEYLEGIFGHRTTDLMLDRSPASGITGCQKALRDLPRNLSRRKREQVVGRVATLRAVHEASMRGDDLVAKAVGYLTDLWDIALEVLDRVADFLREGGREMPGRDGRGRNSDRGYGDRDRYRDDGWDQNRRGGRGYEDRDRYRDDFDDSLRGMYRAMKKNVQREADDHSDHLSHVEDKLTEQVGELKRQLVTQDELTTQLAEQKAALKTGFELFKTEVKTSVGEEVVLQLDPMKIKFADFDRKMESVGQALSSYCSLTR